MSTTDTVPPPAPEAPSLTPGGDAPPPPAPAAPSAPEPPFVLPEKWKGKTIEDVAKAHAALEKKLGERVPPPPPDIGEVEIDYEQVWAASGIKPDEIAASVKKDGRLTDEQYAKLATIKVKDKNGRDVPIKLSRSVIDSHIAGQAAAAELQARDRAALESRGHEAAGGAERFKVVSDYLKANDATYVADLQKRVNADPSFFPDACKLMAIRYQEKTGTAGSAPPISGGNAPTSAGVGYASSAEYFAAMKAAKAKTGGNAWADPEFAARDKLTSPKIRRGD